MVVWWLVAFVRRIHQWLVDSPHKEPVTRKMFPFVVVIMSYSPEISISVYPPSNRDYSPQESVPTDVKFLESLHHFFTFNAMHVDDLKVLH